MDAEEVRKAILDRITAQSPCADCHAIHEEPHARRHLSCALKDVEAKDRQELASCFDFLGDWLSNVLENNSFSRPQTKGEIRQLPMSSIEEGEVRKAECKVYQCLHLLKRFGAWRDEGSACFLLKDGYLISRQRDDASIYLTLNWHKKGEEDWESLDNLWKYHVVSRVLKLLWYLNTSLRGQETEAYPWMRLPYDITYVPGFHQSGDYGCFHCYLTGQSLREDKKSRQRDTEARQLMVRLFDNTMSAEDAHAIAVPPGGANEPAAYNLMPEAVWLPSFSSSETIIHYSAKSLFSSETLFPRQRRHKNDGKDQAKSSCKGKGEATPLGHQPVFLLVPVLPEKERRFLLNHWKEQVREDVRRIVKKDGKYQHHWVLVFLLAKSELKKQCEKAIRALNNELYPTKRNEDFREEEKPIIVAEGDEESPLERMAQRTELLSRWSSHCELVSWRDWNMKKKIAESAEVFPKEPPQDRPLDVNWILERGVFRMATRILVHPDVRPPKRGVLEPVTTPYIPEQYRKVLNGYFDLKEMYACLSDILGCDGKGLSFSEADIKASLAKEEENGSVHYPPPTKGVPRAWNSQSHGDTLFEPPHGDRKCGVEWHEAHNTALFLLLVAAVVRELRDGKELDVVQFRKDVRALTAKLDFKNKRRINARKTAMKREPPRGQYKEKDIVKIVKETINDLLFGSPENYATCQNSETEE